MTDDNGSEVPDATIGTIKNFVEQRRSLLAGPSLTRSSLSGLVGEEVAQQLAHVHDRRWAIRTEGSGITKGVVDIRRLSELLDQWGSTVRHISALLYPRHGAWPGIAVANTAGSVVIEMTPGVGEAPITAKHGAPEYPTIVAGQFIGALLLDEAQDPESLDRRLSPLKGMPIRAYRNLVTYMAEHEISADVIVPVPEDKSTLPADAGTEFAHATLSHERAVSERNLLERTPRWVTEQTTIVGILDNWSYNEGWAVILGEKPKGKLRVEYESGADVEEGAMRAALRQLQGKRVEAQVEVTKPEFDWLPKARGMKASRRLISVARFEGRPQE